MGLVGLDMSWTKKRHEDWKEIIIEAHTFPHSSIKPYVRSAIEDMLAEIERLQAIIDERIPLRSGWMDTPPRPPG